MSSGRSVVDYSRELLIKQFELSKCISQTIRNAGKLNKAQRTQAAYERKLNRLQESWDRFKKNHLLLEQHAPEIYKKAEYFQENIRKQTEIQYEQSLGYLRNMATASMQMFEMQRSSSGKPSTNSQDGGVVSRRNSTAIEVDEEYEILIIESEEKEEEIKHVPLMDTSEPQVHVDAKGNENPSGTNLKTARKLNQLQIQTLHEALEAAQRREANIQRDLQTTQQKITDIRQSIRSAQRQEDLYNRHERKSAGNELPA